MGILTSAPPPDQRVHSSEIEFTEAPKAAFGATALYRLYDADGVLLYVGVTGALKTRVGSHAKRKPWWPEVRRKTYQLYPSRSEGDDAEDAAIDNEHPRYNRRGVAPGRRLPRNRLPMPSLPLRSQDDLEDVMAAMHEVLGSELSHAHRLLTVTHLLLTGSAKLPHGSELATLAGYCDISYSMAFQALRTQQAARAFGASA